MTADHPHCRSGSRRNCSPKFFYIRSVAPWQKHIFNNSRLSVYGNHLNFSNTAGFVLDCYTSTHFSRNETLVKWSTFYRSLQAGLTRVYCISRHSIFILKKSTVSTAAGQNQIATSFVENTNTSEGAPSTIKMFIYKCTSAAIFLWCFRHSLHQLHSATCAVLSLCIGIKHAYFDSSMEGSKGAKVSMP